MNSGTLQEMIKNKKGYRTEIFRGSGVRNLEDIIRFEISLGNSDIVDYMKDNYEILELISCNCDDLEEFSYECQDNIDYIMEEIMEFLTEELNVKKDKLTGLWLTSKEDVISYYEGENCVDEYDLSKDYVVISDLGNEGALFVFSEDIKN